MVAQESTIDCSSGPSPLGTVGLPDGDHTAGEYPITKELNNNCMRNTGFSPHSKDVGKVFHLKSGELPSRESSEIVQKLGTFNSDIVNAATLTKDCPGFDTKMEDSAQKKKRRFRPAPEMQNYTIMDYVHCKPSGEYFHWHSSNVDHESPKSHTLQIWEWDERVEMLADECTEEVTKSRRCSSIGPGRRPRQENKATRAQKQIAEKQYRSTTVLRNTGGKPVRTVRANHSVICKNTAREDHLADSVAAKKANIEKKLISLKFIRRGPPSNLPDPTATSSSQPGGKLPSGKPTNRPTKPVKFELNENDVTKHANTEEDTQLLKILVLIQGRDLLPEDYDLLLRLDEKVPKKTVGSTRLKNLRTKVLTLEDVSGEGEDTDVAGATCAICMEVYRVDEVAKWLPCEHVFHETCINMWLSNSGSQCPLDGLEV